MTTERINQLLKGFETGNQTGTLDEWREMAISFAVRYKIANDAWKEAIGILSELLDACSVFGEKVDEVRERYNIEKPL